MPLRLYPIFLAVLLMGACSSGFQGAKKRPYKFLLNSSPNACLVVANHEDTLGLTPLTVSITPELDSLHITLSKDSIGKTVKIRGKRRPWGFHFEEDTMLGFIPYLRLRRNEGRLRWQVPRRSFVELSEEQLFPLYRNRHPGDLRITFAIPYLNSFSTPTLSNKVIDKWGFLGLSLGAQYQYHQKRYAQLELGVASSFLMPLPVPIDYVGNYELRSTAYLAVSLHQQWKRWEASAGIHYSSLFWNRRIGMDADSLDANNLKPEASWVGRGLGPRLGLAYRMGPFCSLEALYQPILLATEPRSQAGYWHFLSFGFRWGYLAHKRG